MNILQSLDYLYVSFNIKKYYFFTEKNQNYFIKINIF